MISGPVYKLLSEADWTVALETGETATEIDLADGYVHLSARDQVEDTARRYFAAAGRVRLLRFSPASLPPLEWEPSRGGSLFPHLYGALYIKFAEVGWWLERDADGALIFPADV